jgi:hypothetical protein
LVEEVAALTAAIRHDAAEARRFFAAAPLAGGTGHAAQQRQTSRDRIR